MQKRKNHLKRTANVLMLLVQCVHTSGSPPWALYLWVLHSWILPTTDRNIFLKNSIFTEHVQTFFLSVQENDVLYTY
jgi:hypothetical protein